MDLIAEEIAEIAHEANRALRVALGEDPGPPWANAHTDVKASVIDGVFTVLDGRAVTPAEIHENWVEFRTAQGWCRGTIKSEEEKTHPNLVPFEELPEEQKVKDSLFFGIVTSLQPHTLDGTG